MTKEIDHAVIIGKRIALLDLQILLLKDTEARMQRGGDTVVLLAEVLEEIDRQLSTVAEEEKKMLRSTPHANVQE
jgi:hypothetical protein